MDMERKIEVRPVGGKHVSGYGAHGRARLAGRARSFDVVVDGRVVMSWPLLRDARAHAERLAAVHA